MSVSLVTGGCGFIGRHVTALLSARGERMRVLDLAGTPDLPAGVEFIRGSVLDHAVTRDALEGVDQVYHLAAIPHLWTRDRADFDRVNREGTEAMLAAGAKANIGRFIHCSTEAVLLHARAGGESTGESGVASLSDMSGPYTRSKFLAEQAVYAASRKGLHVVVVNPTLPIGPGDVAMTPPTAMIAHFITNPSPFFVNCVLNLVDVRDVAHGMVLAAERGRAGERYILGGENVGLDRILAMLGRMSGRKMPSVSLPGTLALMAGLLLEWIATNITQRPPAATAEGVRLALQSSPIDISKARRELGYHPRPIEGALGDAVAWLLRRIGPERPPGGNSQSITSCSAEANEGHGGAPV